MLKRMHTQSTVKSIKNAMSLEKSVSPQSKQENQEQVQKLSAISHGTKYTRIHQLVQGGDDLTDDKLLFKVELTQQTPVPRVRHIIMKNVVYLISNWTSDTFPNVVYIGLDGATGYKNKLGATTRIAALELQQVVCNNKSDQTDLRTYQLTYKINDSVTWQLVPNHLLYKFRIFIDDSMTAEVLPLPNPLTLNFEIRSQ